MLLTLNSYCSPATNMIKALKPKELKFIELYIKTGGNGSAAVKQAGITSDDNYAGVVASRMLKNAKILQSIKEHSETTGLSIERIMRRLSHIIEKGRDSDSIQAIKVWGDLTGAFAPKSIRLLDQMNQAPKTPQEIDEILKRMRSRHPNAT